MNIITDRQQCEAIIESLNESILNDYGYKRLLNSIYQPDHYFFFEQDNKLLPLVSKEGLVTFYGGTRHNAATRLPDSPALINEAIRHLIQEGYRFQFVSILNDVFAHLSLEHRQFDIPYKVEWHYRNIRHYHPGLLLEGSTGKRRWSWQRLLRKRDSYTFETIAFKTLESRFEELMKAHNAYFQERGKASVWLGAEGLLLQILAEFNCRHTLLIRMILQDGEPRAIYTIVHNNEEMIYYFGGSLSQFDHYVSKVMYLDLLDQARAIACDSRSSIESLNGLAGAFKNKPVFGFSPKPLYALVNDPNWVARPDPGVELELYFQTYGRTFGIEQPR